MNRQEAKELLLYHGMVHPNNNHPKWKNGFLGMLRPFKGTLVEENFYEVMECIRLLADDLGKNDKLDKDVISAIWRICQLPRSWAVINNNMTKGSTIISNQQVKTLDNWRDQISYVTMTLLEGVESPVN
ncbi:MAG: hypothetical protein MI922_01630 [Bacteroidales bacterium]|nr:hypothetical protein [Bacteroidales bacterium]